MEKSPDAFRTISEVADWLGTPTHVLRFWESRFTQVKPVKRAGGRRYYRPKDMALLGGIKKLLHEDGMTIRGVQKLLRDQGVAHVEQFSRALGDDSQRLSATDEAPIDIDVEPSTVRNVVQLGERHAVKTPDEPERGPRGDILTGPTPADLGQDGMATREKPTPEQETEIEPALLLGEPEAKPDESKDLEPEPRKPFKLDVPEEPEDSVSSTAKPGITGVAAALRAASDASANRKPQPEVFSEVFERLTTLRARMNQSRGQDSTD